LSAQLFGSASNQARDDVRGIFFAADTPQEFGAGTYQPRLTLPGHLKCLAVCAQMKLSRYIVLIAILMVVLIAIIANVSHLISSEWASLVH